MRGNTITACCLGNYSLFVCNPSLTFAKYLHILMTLVTFVKTIVATRFAHQGKAYSATRVGFMKEAKVRRGGDFYGRYRSLKINHV